MRMTDIDVQQLNRQIASMAEKKPVIEQEKESASYYKNVEAMKQRGIYEYAFENATEFRAMLEDMWGKVGNEELLPLAKYCTASALRFGLEKRRVVEECEVTDFIYEF